MKSAWHYDFPIGTVWIAEEDGVLRFLLFGNDTDRIKDFAEGETPLLKKAADQLDEYFSGTRKVFDLPLLMEGTGFQKSVWEALRTIPFGETRSYQDIAVLIGNPDAVRAVGMANNRNPIAIIVPCHRVIGKDGSMVGFGGGLPIKRFLLELEECNPQGLLF